MKCKRLVFIVLLFIGLFSPNCAMAQQPYSIVYDLYFAIVVMPEDGDAIIARNQRLFDNHFYRCLNEVHQRYTDESQNHYQFCDSVHINPARRQQCYRENEPAKFAQWFATINQVTRGQIRWSNTIIGQATILGKQQLGALYVNLQRQITPLHRPYMICQ